MNAPLKWLQAYAPFTCTRQEFSDRMTMSGTKVESYSSEADNIKKVVVGRIEALEKHPNADHLFVCTVNVGADENLTICTGADNLKVGDYIPVALHGARLPGGVEIRRTKMRGVESNGMLCSLSELGLTQHDFPNCIEDGIMTLEEPAPLGQDATVALGLDDVSYEFEITPNRPDCLSIVGIAREAAATFGVPFNYTDPVAPAGTVGNINDYLKKAVVEARDTCMRYSAAVVTNVRVKPSPRWLRERLRLCGVRPINNIVDITNYIMLEYGQPLHAFDLKHVAGAEIHVRMARPGEEIETLDGVQRKLTDKMMVISDVEKPIAIAGVMGGEYSGIYDDTTTIVFESACFDGPSVRTTSRRLGLRTDASARYEKGLNPENCQYGLARALQLVKELDAGDIVKGVLDDYPSPRVERRILLEPDRVNRLLGTDNISRQFMVDTLVSLGFRMDGDTIVVPKWRYDMEGNHDVLEEVARMYGYNNIPSTIMKGIAQARPTPRQVFDREVIHTLLACGYFGCETYSFYSPKNFDMIRLPEDSPLRRTVKIANPLGEDTSIMRTTALPSMMGVVAHNYSAREPAAALYELATIYLPADSDMDLPQEPTVLTMARYGGDADFYAVKGAVESVLHAAGIDDAVFVADKETPSYHPGRTAAIYLGDERLGTVGEIHPEVLRNYDIRTRVWAAELNLETLFAHRGGTRVFKPLPRHPSIVRDLALVADEGLPAADIVAAIRKGAGNLLADLSLFDVYTGPGVAPGKKSLAYSLKLRQGDRTLTDEEADAAVAKVLKAVEALGVTLRS